MRVEDIVNIMRFFHLSRGLKSDLTYQRATTHMVWGTLKSHPDSRKSVEAEVSKKMKLSYFLPGNEELAVVKFDKSINQLCTG